MKYVLDSSTAVKWVLPEIHSDKALRARDAFQQGVHDLLAPDIFAGEVGHALTRAERKGIIQAGQAVPLLNDVLQTCPVLHRSYPLLLRACEISSQMRTGFFDCLYVALAEQEQCEFLTADDKVLKNLATQFRFIVPLASMP